MKSELSLGGFLRAFDDHNTGFRRRQAEQSFQVGSGGHDHSFAALAKSTNESHSGDEADEGDDHDEAGVVAAAAAKEIPHLVCNIGTSCHRLVDAQGHQQDDEEHLGRQCWSSRIFSEEVPFARLTNFDLKGGVTVSRTHKTSLGHFNFF